MKKWVAFLHVIGFLLIVVYGAHGELTVYHHGADGGTQNQNFAHAANAQSPTNIFYSNFDNLPLDRSSCGYFKQNQMFTEIGGVVYVDSALMGQHFYSPNSPTNTKLFSGFVDWTIMGCTPSAVALGFNLSMFWYDWSGHRSGYHEGLTYTAGVFLPSATVQITTTLSDGTHAYYSYSDQLQGANFDYWNGNFWGFVATGGERIIAFTIFEDDWNYEPMYPLMDEVWVAYKWEDGGSPPDFSVLPAGIVLPEPGYSIRGTDIIFPSQPTYSAIFVLPPDAVPLPASVLLLGSGLLGLACWRSFRKR